MENFRQGSDTNSVANEIRIVLIGRTGVGKSTTGNTILGLKKIESKLSASSITKKCQKGDAYVNGSGILVVDTPGLFDTGMTTKQVLQEVAKCVGISAPGPHAFILVVSVDRFTKEEEDTVKLFIKHFGEQILKYMIVLFTKKDAIERSNTSIEEYLKEVPTALKQILDNCENRFIAFNNIAAKHEKEIQVNELLDLIRQMVRRNGGSYYTHAMYKAAEENIQQLIETQRRNFRKRQQQQKDKLYSQWRASQEPSDHELRSNIRDGIEKEDKGVLASVFGYAASAASVGYAAADPIGGAIGAVVGGVFGFVKGLF